MLLGLNAAAQEPDSDQPLAPELGLEYTTELQTDFHRNYNMMNLLQLRATLPISSRISAEASTITLARTSRDAIVDDQQGFSSIDGPNVLLAPAVLGFRWHINRQHSLFAGVRTVNEDYFTTDLAQLFVNSSPGIFPAIRANYPLCDYPLASMGLHYDYNAEKFGFMASLYNGAGHKNFWGRDNVFRISPRGEGLLLMAQGQYKHRGSSYVVGGALHQGYVEDAEGRKARPIAWAYAEQRVADNLSLIGAYSRALHSDAYCTDFVGAGGRLTIGTVDVGLFADYAHFEDDEEWALEMTCQIPLTDWCYLQPTLQFIKNTDLNTPVGVLRFGIEL